MKSKIYLLACLLSVFCTSAYAEEEETVITFPTGSVIIYCVAPSQEEKISIDTFNEAFGWWITKLDTHAQEGRVIRAHFLNDFHEGIFIVVGGETAEDAMINAKGILAENQEIMRSAIEKTDGDSSATDSSEACQLIPIGPVAILPRD